MILEAICRVGLAFVSVFTSETLRLVQPSAETTSVVSDEYLEINFNNEASETTTTTGDDARPRSPDENNLGNNRPVLFSGQTMKRSIYGAIICQIQSVSTPLRSSFLPSVLTSFTILFLIIPISIVLILVLYTDINTTNLCFEQTQRGNKTHTSIMTWWLIGHDVEAVLLNFWFQSSIILLFGWRKFKSRHSSTLLLGFLLGCTVAIYKTTLFIRHLDFTKQSYRYFGNFLFLVGVVSTGYLVAKQICSSGRARVLSKLKVFAIISTQFFLGFIIAMVYRYAIVPWFNEVQNEIEKAVIAMITPTLILIPMVICEHLAMNSSTFVKPDRVFVLVYFVNGVSTMLYCIMQAGVTNIWIFTGLSIFRGALQVVQTATENLRHKIFFRFWEFLRMACHCARLGPLTPDTDHYRRLMADKEIQLMFHQHTALVLSQAYLALYLIANFDTDPWNILKDLILTRISIGLGTNFIANLLSIFIQIHWRHKSYVDWLRHTVVHILADTLMGAMTIWYFTSVLLTVFHNSSIAQGLDVVNCTAPWG